MRRREFITLLGGAAAGWPLAARAQQPAKVHRVGFIASVAPVSELVGANPSSPVARDFVQGLRELGYVEGKNLVLEWRSAELRLERMPELVAELVGLKVDVLVAPAGPAALAAKNATQTIPIVMMTADPVGLGLIGSLSRPGGNVTGLSFYYEAITAKKLELLKELVPGLARVGVLRNPPNPGDPIFWKEAEVAAQRLGVALEDLEVRGPEDFEAAFATAKQRSAQALLAFDNPLTFAYRSRVTALAASSRLPVMYGSREFPDAGGLMSYGPSIIHLYRQAASFVDKILKGAKPADLPVEQPTKFELVINVKVAKALSLTVPPSLLTLADEVIE
jgi:putative ABC transport system substrate-binding protein